MATTKTLQTNLTPEQAERVFGHLGVKSARPGRGGRHGTPWTKVRLFRAVDEQRLDEAVAGVPLALVWTVNAAKADGVVSDDG